MVVIWVPQREAVFKGRVLLQVLSDPRQKRFFKAKDMRDLFTLGDEYANATETSEIFASVNGEVTATLAAEQAPLPELNHAEGALFFPFIIKATIHDSILAVQLRLSSDRGGRTLSRIDCPAVLSVWCCVLHAGSSVQCCGCCLWSSALCSKDQDHQTVTLN